jgi:hypothetical protein
MKKKQYTTTNLINTCYAAQCNTEEIKNGREIQTGWNKYFHSLNEILAFPPQLVARKSR